jgi:transcriptional regulator with XRE-family HTH domain
MTNKKYSIFISSTYEDLKEYRSSIHNAILKMGHFPIAMENFTASNASQWSEITKLIDECDYHILLVGFRYGSVDSVENISYTEKEYKYAESINKPILSFLIDESIGLSKDDNLAQITLFREMILSNNKLSNICRDRNNISADIIASLQKQFLDNPQIGWMKNIESDKPNKKIDLDDIEIKILEILANNGEVPISWLSKEIDLIKREQLLYYLEHLQSQELVFFTTRYENDSDNMVELLPDGRNFIFNSKRDHS